MSEHVNFFLNKKWLRGSASPSHEFVIVTCYFCVIQEYEDTGDEQNVN